MKSVPVETSTLPPPVRVWQSDRRRRRHRRRITIFLIIRRLLCLLLLFPCWNQSGLIFVSLSKLYASVWFVYVTCNCDFFSSVGVYICKYVVNFMFLIWKYSFFLVLPLISLVIGCNRRASLSHRLAAQKTQ